MFSFPLSSGYRLTNIMASWHFHKDLEEARFYVNVMFCSFTSIKRELYTIDALFCSLSLNNVCLFIWLLLHCIILSSFLRLVFIYKTYRKLFSNNFKIRISLCSSYIHFFFLSANSILRVNWSSSCWILSTPFYHVQLCPLEQITLILSLYSKHQLQKPA